MFVVFLNRGENIQLAGARLARHSDWIRQGIDDGVFLLTGSLAEGQGGAIIAHGVTRVELDDRLAADPFVAERIVVPTVTEFEPGAVDDRLAFLRT
jgi:uncharacterized protein YciI